MTETTLSQYEFVKLLLQQAAQIYMYIPFRQEFIFLITKCPDVTLENIVQMCQVLVTHCIILLGDMFNLMKMQFARESIEDCQDIQNPEGIRQVVVAPMSLLNNAF